MTKYFKQNDIVFIHKTKQKGKIVAVTRGIPQMFKVEVITKFDKDNQERTTQLLTLSAEEMSPFRDKGKQPKHNNHLYWAKVNPKAIIPTKRLEDGCYDIYACVDIDEIIIQPHEIVEIPTGIASAFSFKYRLDFQRERGSTGSIGLVPRCGQIDSGYRGEIFLKMQNVTNKTIVISSSAKDKREEDNGIVYPMSKAICQAALEFVPIVEEIELPYEELIKIPSKRGTGKLGSSNK